MYAYLDQVVINGTLLLQVLLVAAGAAALISSRARKWLFSLLSAKGLLLGLLLSLAALLGSLFYSNVLGFAPCELCWYQRILLYPQALLFLIAWLRKDKGAGLYAFWLSVLGLLVSGYQSAMQWTSVAPIFCSGTDGASCGTRYVFAYGYLTIPLMSFTAFLTLAVIAAALAFRKKKA